jgi:Hemerythrin HHE cation binding domain
MTATAVRPLIPAPRSPRDGACDAVVQASATTAGRAVAYQRVLHQLVRRELRMLAELAGWAAPGDAARRTTLTRHADLISRVLLHHHAVEREAVWPALLRMVPDDQAGDVRSALEDWTGHCARIDHMLRDVATAGRQWQVTGTTAARDGFAAACTTVADAVDAQTAEEEHTLLPLLGEHLRLGDWAAIARSSHCRLSGPEQLLVLGLALEDSSSGDRARLLEGLPRSVRLAWRTYGGRHYRAAVVRLRGAPPAA